MTEREIEALIASYMTLAAALFILEPSALSPAIYTSWGGYSPQQWGGLLGVVSSLHFAALWFNGRDRLISNAIRSFACFLHLCVSFLFGLMFILADLPFGALLFWFLLPLLLWRVSVRSLSTWMEIRNGRAPRYANTH